MEPAVHPKNITKTSEQIFNPVYMPIIINNEIYMMVQQDIRMIQETRQITYNKLSEGQCLEAPPYVQQFQCIPQITCPQQVPQETPMDWTTNEASHEQKCSKYTSTKDLNFLEKSCRKPEERCKKLPVVNERTCKCCLAKDVDDVLCEREGEMTALEKLKLKKMNGTG